MQAEKPARDAMKVFEKLYELFGELEREGEPYEVVLGDGILNWRREDGGVSHPILLQKLHFKFYPRAPEFVLNNSDQSPELYSSLFRAMQDVDGRRLAASRDHWFWFLRGTVQNCSGNSAPIRSEPAIPEANRARPNAPHAPDA